jgi:protoporphyrinogen oxidase
MSFAINTIVVGAGVSGLSCALTLKKAGRSVVVLEASDDVGGRVRSDVVDGFTLDRGFQVLLTAYPTCRHLLDFSSLRLGTFDPGAIIRVGKRDSILSDPLRRPGEALATMTSPVGSLADKWKVFRLKQELLGRELDSVWDVENQSTRDFLIARGFSETMLRAFFRPFFSGIFLESSLATSARMFAFVFRCFSAGDAALPAGGMASIPRQLAQALGSESIHLNTPVERIEPGRVVTRDGQTLVAEYIVVATDGDQARQWIPALPTPAWNGGTCYYFDAPRSPFRGKKKLWLNGTGAGRINHMAVPSDIASGYAPTGRSLVAVNTVGGTSRPESEESIHAELKKYFGAEVGDWRFLRRVPVARSLPRFDPEDAATKKTAPLLPPGLACCGDYLSVGSLETAMASGVAAAHRVLA